MPFFLPCFVRVHAGGCRACTGGRRLYASLYLCCIRVGVHIAVAHRGCTLRVIFIHLILTEYGSQQLYTQDFSTLVDISATHTPTDPLLYCPVVKTNDITASYIEQVEMFQKNTKARCLAVRFRLIEPNRWPSRGCRCTLQTSSSISTLPAMGL